MTDALEDSLRALIKTLQLNALTIASDREVLKLELSDVSIRLTKLKIKYKRTQTNKKILENQLRTSEARVRAYKRKEENEEWNESPKDQ